MNSLAYHIPQLFTGFFNLFLGIFVFKKNRKGRVNAAFLTFSIATFFWQILYFVSYIYDENIAYWFLKAGYSFVIFIPPCAYHFSSLWIDSKKEMAYVRFAYIVAVLFLICLWFSDLFMAQSLIHYTWGNYPKAGPIHPLFMMYLFTIVIRMDWNLFSAYKESLILKNSQDTSKTQYAFFSLMIFCVAAIDFVANYGIGVYPIAYLFVGIYCALVTYGIVKHHLLDIRIVLKKTVFYSMSIFFVSIFYVILVFIIHRIFFINRIGQAGMIGSITLIFLIALTLKPIENIIRKFLDKRFFRGTIFEISEQKEKLETELERQQRLKSVGILAAGMAHEIKNPITAIKTFSEYLPTKYNDPQFREKFSEIVSREADRIQGIVTDLLLFSRPTEPHPTEVCINHLLNEILTLLTSDLMKAKVRVTLDFEPLDRKAVVDANQMKQAFLNIIMNAVDAMKESGGGDLTVQTRTMGDHMEVTIGDTGPGIHADKIKHIFDPFYTDKEGGTGLGLAVTHSLIQKNNAKISVQSQAGQGTRFILELCLA